MSISENLTQQRFLEILFYVYLKGQAAEEIKLPEFIEEIKEQLLAEKKTGAMAYETII